MTYKVNFAFSQEAHYCMSERWLILGAFTATYVVWGSTYIFNYWAIDTIPPFFMSGTRFFFAGLLLYLWGVWKKEPSPTRTEWRNATIMGNLFLSLGTGGMVWALQWIDTNMAALLVTFDPLLIMLLMWILLGQRPKGRSIIGAIIAIAGIVLLVGQPQVTHSAGSLQALIVVFIALLSWAIGSIYISRVEMPKSRPRSAAIQMIAGGLGLLLFSVFTGEAFEFHWTKLSLSSTLSWLYLVVLGSIVAYSSFNYLLTKVSPEKVATNTYVNPVVAMLLGWAFNDEVITGQSMLAASILILGVFFINTKEKIEV